MYVTQLAPCDPLKEKDTTYKYILGNYFVDHFHATGTLSRGVVYNQLNYIAFSSACNCHKPN